LHVLVIQRQASICATIRLMKGTAPRLHFAGRVVDDGRILDCFEGAEVPVPLAACEAGPGDFVEVRVEDGIARPVDVLARAGGGLAHLYEIAVSHGLDPIFPKGAMEETGALLASPGLDDPTLEDLRRLPFCSVDDADTRDIDQALHLERDGRGWLVRYALADAAYYVRPGQPLWREAMQRGASFYLPGLVIPMLPRPLSEGLVSLLQGVDRRALVFTMRLDGRGRCVDTQLSRALIHNRVQLSFEEVQEFLDGHESGRITGDLAASLRLLPDIGHARTQLAQERDVVRFRRVQIKTSLGRDGLRFFAHGEHRNDVERHNEQLSLLCNVEGARYLERARPSEGIQPIYRVHPAPPPERFDQFSGLLRGLTRRRGLDTSVWSWQRGERSLATFLRRLPSEPPFSRLSRVVQRHAIRLNLRSTFEEEPAAHFGVGAPVYARFSAPMREMVGIFLHKEAWERVSGSGTADDPVDEALRDAVVDLANRARATQRQLEKESDRLVLDQLFTDDLERPDAERTRHRGTVVGLRPTRAYVLLDEPPADVKVDLRDLESCLGGPVNLDEHGISVVRTDGGEPVMSLGDPVDVVVAGRDAGRNRWRLELRPV
jgi:ribonuclease R